MCAYTNKLLSSTKDKVGLRELAQILLFLRAATKHTNQIHDFGGEGRLTLRYNKIRNKASKNIFWANVKL